jgi:hypothetical protein
VPQGGYPTALRSAEVSQRSDDDGSSDSDEHFPEKLVELIEGLLEGCRQSKTRRSKHNKGGNKGKQPQSTNQPNRQAGGKKKKRYRRTTHGKG